MAPDHMVIVFLPESTRLNDVMPRPQAKAPKALTPLLEIRNLTKSFDGQHAVDDVSLTIYKGEIFALLGASGCGKSTLLRMLAGFEQPTAGQIMLDGVDLARVPPYQRPINMMFQSYALFPHMTVEQNIAFGLKQDRLPKAEITARVQEMLALVHMQEFAKRKPHQLSGGQRQRVAIARALVNEPRVLLLDEPLGALDLKLREQMQFELKKLQQELGITFIFVTHDQGEALSMSDRVAVFNNGRIEQVDTPRDLYMRPRTPFVAGFVGTSNVFDAGLAQKVCGLEGTYSLRPEHIRLNESGEVQVQGVVQAVQYQGAATRLELKLADGAKLLVSQANLSDITMLSGVEPGQAVMASWSRDAMIRLSEER